MNNLENTNLTQLFHYIQKADKTIDKLGNSINTVIQAANKRNDPPKEGGGTDPLISDPNYRAQVLNKKKEQRDKIEDDIRVAWNRFPVDVIFAGFSKYLTGWAAKLGFAPTTVGSMVLNEDLEAKQTSTQISLGLSALSFLSSKAGWLGFGYSIASPLWAISEMSQDKRELNREINALEDNPETIRQMQKMRQNDNSRGTSYPRKNTYKGDRMGIPGGGKGDEEVVEYPKERESAVESRRRYIAQNAYLDNGVRVRANEKEMTKENYVPNEHAGAGKRNKGPDPFEVFQNAFGEAQKLGGALSSLMNTLNIGAHTFVGGLINGFNTALSVINDVLTVFQAIKQIQAAGSLLKSIPFLSWLPFASGGAIPGIGDTDSVPAMLTPGEFVIKKSVVNKFDSGFFEWINDGVLMNAIEEEEVCFALAA